MSRAPATEWGIPFMDSMVLAILEGRKDVTRRVSPRWAKRKPGDRLWGREAWRPDELATGVDGVTFRADGLFLPIEDTREAADRWVAVYRRNLRWRPSIHMPRWASRLTLEVVSVTEERTVFTGGLGQMAALMPKGVDDAEARREGFGSYLEFLAAWRSMHPDHIGPVYRVEFRRLP